MKPKYGEIAKSSYIDSFVVYTKAEDIYADIPKDVKTRFVTSSYELERSLPERKNKKVIGLMKDESGEEIMTEFAALRSKTCSYLTDDNDENRKANGAKKCIMKRKIKFEDYKHCLEVTQLEKKLDQREKLPTIKLMLIVLEKIIKNL